MKYKLMYSPDASDKLKKIKNDIVISHGKTIAIKVVSRMLLNIKGLQDNPYKGLSVEDLLGIATPYRFIHVEHNYAFYRIEENTVFIADIYNEGEDFLRKMFGIKLRTQESIDYWRE